MDLKVQLNVNRRFLSMKNELAIHRTSNERAVMHIFLFEPIRNKFDLFRERKDKLIFITFEQYLILLIYNILFLNFITKNN